MVRGAEGVKSEERRMKNEECSQRVPTANFTFHHIPKLIRLATLFTFHFSLFTTYPSSFAWLHFSLFTFHSSPHTQAHSLGYTFHSSLFTLHSSLFTLHSSLFTLLKNALPSLSFSSYSFPLPAAGGWHMDGQYPLALLCLSLLAGGQ